MAYALNGGLAFHASEPTTSYNGTRIVLPDTRLYPRSYILFLPRGIRARTVQVFQHRVSRVSFDRGRQKGGRGGRSPVMSKRYASASGRPKVKPTGKGKSRIEGRLRSEVTSGRALFRCGSGEVNNRNVYTNIRHSLCVRTDVSVVAQATT